MKTSESISKGKLTLNVVARRRGHMTADSETAPTSATLVTAPYCTATESFSNFFQI
jgi:hypothetical protein